MMDRDRELHEMADEGRALMIDYINRWDAFDAIGEAVADGLPKGWYLPIAIIPSADVAPVRHGRWIKDKMPMYSWGGEKIGEKSTWECSECHDVGFWGYNYCPNCGAKMDR